MFIEAGTERATIASNNISAVTYWGRRLRDFRTEKYFVDPTITPVDRNERGRYTFAPDALTIGELSRVAKTNASKLIMLTTTAAILAQKLSGEKDIIVFSSPASAGILSPATGFVPVRFSDLSNLTFQQCLSEAKRDMIADFSNPIEPSLSIIRKLTVDGMMGVSINRSDVDRVIEPGIVFSFDDVLNVYYNRSVFSEKCISQLCVSFFTVLGNLIAQKDTTIKNIQVLSGPEIAVTDQHKTAGVIDNETILSLFSKQVQRTQKTLAIATGAAQLSYKDLDRLSNRLARFLLARKITKGSRVAIEMGHNQWTIIAILGIMKSGAAYVPIDRGVAAGRKSQILKDSGAGILFVEGIHFSNVDYFKGTVIALDVDLDEMEFDHTPVDVPVSGNDTAYILYTSGSTGKPKGVVISHGALANYVRWATVYCNGAPPAFAFFTSIAFDLTVTSIFLPLITGGKIVALNWGADLKSMLEDPNTDIIKLTPSHLRLLNAVPGINTSSWKKNKVLIVGGEMFGSELAGSIYKKCDGRVDIYNEYGPTEATVGCMIHQFSPTDDSRSVPIGRSIDNMRIYLLNKDLQPVPPNFIGEIYISGMGLADGYLSDEKQTASVFVDDPFEPGFKMYKSGDLAYRMDDTIIYSGRADRQVKIRGFRIEMEEVASVVSKHPAVNQAVVVCKIHNEEPCLVVFYEAPHEVATDEFMQFLGSHLPEYMIPSFFRRVSQIPLTTNGKLDESVLTFEVGQSKSTIVAPETNVEDRLTSIWSDILQVDKEKIGVNESFFSLGGHSLYAVSLIYRIREEFGVDIDLDQVFELKTIRALSDAISKTNLIRIQPLPKPVERTFFPASSAQERLFFGQLANPGSLTNNIPRSYRIQGNFDLAKLRTALNALLERHESLRTGFELDGNELRQRIYHDVKVTLQMYHARNFRSPDAAFTDFTRPFDLHGMSMIRFALYMNAGHQYEFLFVDIHHIVCDGLSLDILMNDFMDLYENKPLATLKSRYVDYACEQRSGGKDHRGHADLRRQKDYWLKQLSGEIPRVPMPLKGDRRLAEIHDTDTETVRLSTELYRRIKDYCKSSDVTPFVYFLSAYYLAVAKISGENDIIIGTDAIGRSHPDLGRVVGTFINVLPLRVGIDMLEPFSSLVRKVKRTTLDGFACQDYQIDQLVADLRKTGQNKLFDLYFSYTNFFSERRDHRDATFQPVALGAVQAATRYELELNVDESKGNARLTFIYSPNLYDRQTIFLLLKYYSEILETSLTTK